MAPEDGEEGVRAGEVETPGESGEVALVLSKLGVERGEREVVGAGRGDVGLSLGEVYTAADRFEGSESREKKRKNRDSSSSQRASVVRLG